MEGLESRFQLDSNHPRQLLICLFFHPSQLPGLTSGWLERSPTLEVGGK